MEIRTETQLNVVADEVSAITAVVAPILVGTLYSLKSDVVAEAGGRANLKLRMLARLRRPGDGDCGICFEYAVHDAMNRHDHAVVERVIDALNMCRVPGETYGSILFGAEKTGSQQLVNTAKERLTKDSSLLSGSRGRPVKLLNHLNSIAAAFRKPTARAKLPQSISGLWKADLFLGHPMRTVGLEHPLRSTRVLWKVHAACGSVSFRRERGLRIGFAWTTRGIWSSARCRTMAASWRSSIWPGKSSSNF